MKNKILWQSRSPVLYEAVLNGHLPAGANGGNAYDFSAAMTLRESFDLKMDEVAVMKKQDSFRTYWWRMAHHTPNADVVIAEPSPIVFGKRNKKARTVAMIHHIDDVLANSSVRHRWFFDRLKRRLSKVDLVVTVSAYWEEYLAKLGCKKVRTIYNSFDPKEYELSEKEIELFRRKYNFKANVPIVYLGNAHRQKGVFEAYEALKEKNYQLVMTGSRNNAKDLPVKFLTLDDREYKALLCASSLAVTLSNMTEGWNRIAHEALLCHTPVIGSGTGGMQELLDGGGQLTVKDLKLLSKKVEEVLQDRKQIADKGYAYVRKFDRNYFKTEWTKVIHELTGA